MSDISRGARCAGCKRTEQECAFAGGTCCDSCSHWIGYDRNGNPPIEAPGRRLLPVEHGTERGYQQHRVRHEPACRDCKTAHSRRNAKGAVA